MGAVVMLSDAQVAAKSRALPAIRAAIEAGRAALGVVGVPEALSGPRSTLEGLCDTVSGDALAEGELARMIAACDPEGAKARGPAATIDLLTESIESMESWARGAEVSLAGGESAGILSDLAASGVADAIIQTGMTFRELAGVKTETYNGLDNAELAAAKDRASMIQWGSVAVAAVIVLGIGVYIWWEVG